MDKDYCYSRGRWIEDFSKADEFTTSFKLFVGKKKITVKAKVKGFSSVTYPKWLPSWMPDFILEIFKKVEETVKITFNKNINVIEDKLTNSIVVPFNKNLSNSWMIFEYKTLPEIIENYKKFMKEHDED